MNKITELREQRAKAWETAKAFLDSKRSKDGFVSAEDTATYERMEADVVNLGKEIDRLERQVALDAEMAQATSKPLVGKPTTNTDTKTGRASDDYKHAFWNAIRAKNPAAEVLNSLSIGTDTEGGFLVPDEFERILVQALEKQNFMRTLANVITTTSGEKKIPIVASNGMASWVDEGAAIPDSDPSFGQTNIGAHKLASLIKISEELLKDSAFNMEQFVAQEFARQMGKAEEQAFLVGVGNDRPTGLFSTATVGVTTAGNAVTLDEIIDLYHSLDEAYRDNATFIMNDLTLKSLRKIKDGNGQYIWQPSFQAGTPDMILGRPVKTSSFAPTITAGAKTILFGDFKYYWVADREVRTFRRLNELYAATGQVGFLASQRVDGKLILPEAVKALAMKA